ncbi:MAG: HAMP domain-containing protein [Chloroflexota bacterium]|nr:HAMP domain-containing protein [Chloroflexota bacterium]
MSIHGFLPGADPHPDPLPQGEGIPPSPGALSTQHSALSTSEALGTRHSALGTSDGPRGLAGFLTGRISTKIVGPYLAIMFLMAVLGTFVVLRQVSTSLEQRFSSQLLDAGRAVNDAVIKVEQEQVELERLMAATDGVDAAIVKKDPVALQKLLVPLEANSQYSVIDVVDAGGREVLALRPGSGPLARAVDPNISQWDVVKKSAAGVPDDLGDKYSDLVFSSFGPLLYTGGPVRDAGGKSVGAILVGLPFNDLLARLTKDVLANITVYGPDGRPLGTTLGVPKDDPSLSIDAQTYQKVTGQAATQNGSAGGRSQQVIQRPLQAGGQQYMELVGGLIIRHKTVGALGVAVPTNAIAEAGAQTRTQMTILFSAVVFVVLIIGLVLARRITAPILVLVKACQLVATGDLEQQVNVKSKDETGVLAHTFNHMVSGLKERDFIRDTFGKYMSEAVSEAILNGDVKLGGERKTVTVLVSHIRSSGGQPFTGLYETMEAEGVVALLNSYFHSMVDCIVKYEGVVDKFVGDEILAVFGAPIAHQDDARRGVLAALEMRRRVVEFNRQMEESGRDPIRVGIGLYSGPVVSGNIGSEVRMEYTVIGDTVNCTARTEELTKEYHTDLLIGDTTYELITDYVDVARPIMITLRGRTQESAIYPVLGLKQGYEELISDQGPLLVSSGEPMTQQAIDAELARR